MYLLIFVAVGYILKWILLIVSKYKNLPVLVSGIGVRGSISASKQVRGTRILWTVEKQSQRYILL